MLHRQPQSLPLRRQCMFRDFCGVVLKKGTGIQNNNSITEYLHNPCVRSFM